MDKIDEIKELLAVFPTRLNDIFTSFMMDNQDMVVELNVQQMMMGLMPTGDYIEPSYSASYAREKRMNPWTMPNKPMYTPDLRSTGAFHRSIFLVKEPDGVSFDSSDRKWEGSFGAEDTRLPLHSVYGDVLGLSEESMDELKPSVNEEMCKQLRMALGIDYNI